METLSRVFSVKMSKLWLKEKVTCCHFIFQVGSVREGLACASNS